MVPADGAAPNFSFQSFGHGRSARPWLAAMLEALLQKLSGLGDEQQGGASSSSAIDKYSSHSDEESPPSTPTDTPSLQRPPAFAEDEDTRSFYTPRSTPREASLGTDIADIADVESAEAFESPRTNDVPQKSARGGKDTPRKSRFPIRLLGPAKLPPPAKDVVKPPSPLVMSAAASASSSSDALPQKSARRASTLLVPSTEIKEPSTARRGSILPEVGAMRSRAERTARTKAAVGRTTSVIMLDLRGEETSFGLILNEAMRVVEIDGDTPAARSGLHVLDLIVAVDGDRTSAYTIGEQIAGKRRIELVVVRPAERELGLVAREENVDEWSQWEQIVLACARGEIAQLEARLLGRGAQSQVSRLMSPAEAIERRLIESEANAFNLMHELGLKAGQRLTDVALQHGHIELVNWLRKWGNSRQAGRFGSMEDGGDVTA